MPTATAPTVDQMAKDVSAFLVWTAEPKLESRHAAGIAVVIFLLFATVLGYLAYRQIWAEAKRKVAPVGPLDPDNKARRNRASAKPGGISRVQLGAPPHQHDRGEAHHRLAMLVGDRGLGAERADFGLRPRRRLFDDLAADGQRVAGIDRFPPAQFVDPRRPERRPAPLRRPSARSPPWPSPRCASRDAAMPPEMGLCRGLVATGGKAADRTCARTR